ncbi:MAG: tRNA (cytidine(34)-2'-O)-methyltransferase, partial [Bacteriovoracaceae bacterium]|nr:tRNA (cytidine(34)-2'-O)-methyltransferase [Bacteriovoracaceae bacterium]
MSGRFKIVLVAPEIPGNTGSIGRTCLALDAELILIKPYGFDLSEKAVRRAGLDYWKHVKIKEYESFEEFMSVEKPLTDHMYLMTKTSKTTIFEAKFKRHGYLIFGSETKGLPPELMTKYKDRCFSLPMYDDNIRSLNLSNAATAVAYETLRQVELL